MRDPAGSASRATWQVILLAGTIALCALAAVAATDYVRVQSRLDFLDEQSPAFGGPWAEAGLRKQRERAHEGWERRRVTYAGGGAVIVLLTTAGVTATRGRGRVLREGRRPDRRRGRERE
ncbi:MAG: hypothetical protein ICV64_07870 [Thermoleophilia bacterium]|nr:hypothetical protein [Thermoleophilia bacterium]